MKTQEEKICHFPHFLMFYQIFRKKNVFIEVSQGLLKLRQYIEAMQ